ncbi:MAG: copper resistance protein CopC [Candidatus Sumerlaeaceae bacterium]|nr:copper resistance protein CopC [Candidatus Sumerlaeaceae bacterium]
MACVRQSGTSLLRIVISATTLILLCVGRAPSEGIRTYLPLPEPEAPTSKDFPNARLQLTAPNSLQNAGFEDLTPSGDPAHWNIFREAYTDSEALLAHTGNCSVRASFLFGWYQRIQVPGSPFQHFALTGYASRERPSEQAGVRAVYYDDIGNRLREVFDTSPIGSPSGWGWFATVFPVPVAAADVELFLASRGSQTWIRYDDLSVLTEQLYGLDRPYGAPPLLTGGAVLTSSGLTLPGGSAARYLVATGRTGEQYFITGRYAATSPAALSISDEWLSRGASESSVTSEVTLPLDAGTGDFTADLARPDAPASGISVVTLFAATSGAVTLGSVWRGFAKVEPQILTVGLASPDIGPRFTAALPLGLTSGTVDVLDGSGVMVASPPVVRHGTSIRSSWDTTGAPAGGYTVRFRLISVDGVTVEVTRPLTLLRDDTSATMTQPLRPTAFVRGAYAFVFFDRDPVRISDALRLARQDGFNFAFIHCRLDQLAAARAAAEAYEMPFVPVLNEPQRLFADYLQRDWFSREDVTSRVRSWLAPVTTSPLFRGVYVADEPVGDAALEFNRRFNLAIEQHGGLGQGFSVWTTDATTASITAVAPPVVIIDVYPFRSDRLSDHPSALLAEIPRMNAYARAAAGVGRDLWIMPQAFEADETFVTWRAVPESMHTAQLGAALLAGARGVVPFMHTPATIIEGLRGPDFEPTKKLTSYLEFNSIMDRLTTHIMALAPPILLPDVPPPFAASVAQHPTEGNHLFVLNADDLVTRTLSLVMFPALPSPPLDLVSGQPVALGAGSTIEVTLGPGRWALIATGDSSATAASALPAPPPNLSDMSLAVTHQFTVEALNGLPQPVHSLQFSPDTRYLVASSAAFPREQSYPLVYRLDADGVVTRLTGPLIWNNTRTAWLSGDRIARMGPNTGIRIYSLSGINLPPLAEFTGRSGGAFDVVPINSDYCITQGGYGLRRLSVSGSMLQSVEESGFSAYGVFEDLFGPFADGSVTLVSEDSAVRNAKPGSFSEDSHVTMPISRLRARASLNGRNLLAVPRASRGAVLVQLAATGEPVTSATIATEATEVTAATWVSDDVLALADGAYHVRFYRVRPDGRSLLVGRWRPPASGPLYIRSLAAGTNRLAVGLEDGRVFVVDAADVGSLNACAPDWSRYE